MRQRSSRVAAVHGIAHYLQIRCSAKHWGIPFIGLTPDMPKKPRRNEILAWLKDHPNVRGYAVIDDEDDEL